MCTAIGFWCCASACTPVALDPNPPTPDFVPHPIAAGEAFLSRWGQMATEAIDGDTTLLIGGTDIRISTDEGQVFSDLVKVQDTNEGLVATSTPVTGLPRRYCGCAALNPTNNSILVIGGFDEAGTAQADAWRIDVSTAQAERITGQNATHPGVIGCSAVFVPGSNVAFVFGGAAASFTTATLSRYNDDTRSFTDVDAPGPSARYDHGARLAADGRTWWIVGGTLTPFSGFLADAWTFDLVDETWRNVEIGTLPGRRAPWLALADDDSLRLGFGTTGLARGTALGDAFALREGEAASALDSSTPRAFSVFVRGQGGRALIVGGTDLESPMALPLRLEEPDRDFR